MIINFGSALMRSMLLMRIVMAVSFGIILGGCEGNFVGERPYNIQILNGTSEMKLVNLGAKNYLAVLNTNLQFKASTGNLQFYLLEAPASASAPSLQTSMSLELPSNVGDFVIDGTTLFVADRNRHHILIYDFADGKFSPRLDASSAPKFINVSDQPQRLVVFSRASDSKKVLAVLCQSSGTIHFILLETFEFISKGDTVSGTADLFVTGGINGAQFTAYPRRTINTDDDDPIHFPQFPSYGINQLVYLGGTEQLFVTASSLSLGLLSFRLDRFQNAANLTWNLPKSKDGVVEGTQEYPGSHENGFRGLARDGQGKVFATSRTDNSIYQIPRSEFESLKVAASGETVARRNTRGFDDDNKAYLLKSLDTDRTDEIFPRLGPIIVNYCASAGPTGCKLDGAAATVAWVLGYGTKEGDVVKLAPKVYRIDLGNLDVKQSSDSALGDSPQRILWNPSAALLYVANVKDSSISILRDDDLSLVGTLTTP